MTEPASPPSYKDTLNLPKTSFDMKANLTQREPEMLKRWQGAGGAQSLYQKIRAARANAPKGKWVLHDGPPYANGDIHIGHLVNKVLKDIVVKFRTMQGYDSPYVPGWDCHGLPIESAIQKELGPKFRELSKDDVRKRCQEYALKYVKLQGDSFQRLGIFGSFDKPYLTLDPKYEAGVLEVLAELVQRDLVYRQKKPVHWCTNDRTALAEAELEYGPKKDTSVYVSWQIQSTKAGKEWDELMQRVAASFKQLRPELSINPYFYLMIWTTTPWTLPANRAIAINPKNEYVFVHYLDSTGKWRGAIVAAELSKRIGELEPASDFHIADVRVTGDELARHGVFYRNLVDGLICPVVLADYVTLEDGTGLVHTAPGHGKEDYATGQKYGLETYNPVMPDGRYDDTVPEFLRGKSIWDASQLVIDKLKETGALFHAQEFSHEYPHCWRCKKPTIQRATEQWFIKASSNETPSEPRPSGSDPSAPHTEGSLPHGRGSDGQSKIENQKSKIDSPLWSTAKQFVDQVKWIPSWGKNRIDGMLDTRPDWCISRQRSWGVPIPAFFNERGEVQLTEKSVRRIAEHFRTHGADSWYTHTPAQLLGLEDSATQTQGLQSLGLSPDLNLAALDKGLDILDVWFESGASHHAVLECTHPELGYPANMYLEGSDQHRGWFQSSLLEAAGYKSEPPFKEVLTHGFVVDDKGMKYSKSSGNYVPVEKLLTQHGADVLRLWVSSVDYQNDIKFSTALLTTISEAYRKIRNTMRYLLGNLYDFDPQIDAVEPHAHSIDAWMQNRVHSWAADIRSAYDRYEFHTVFKLIYEFCNVEISALYAKAIKDRLYCELPTSPKRRASQTVCFRALTYLIELCAPVLTFTAEEAWGEVRKLPGCALLETSVHLHAFETQDAKYETMKQNMNQLTGLFQATGAPDATKESGGALINALGNLAEMTTAIRGRLGTSAALKAHWAILMPLIEKGNKQLDDLKRTIGLGNPLDAEAVIILPSVEDEVSKHIADYGPEIEDALGVGFHRIEHGEIWDIKINDTRKLYSSCARSWKRRPDVGSDKDYPDLSARDAAVVRALKQNP